MCLEIRSRGCVSTSRFRAANSSSEQPTRVCNEGPAHQSLRNSRTRALGWNCRHSIRTRTERTHQGCTDSQRATVGRWRRATQLPHSELRTGSAAFGVGSARGLWLEPGRMGSRGHGASRWMGWPALIRDAARMTYELGCEGCGGLGPAAARAAKVGLQAPQWTGRKSLRFVARLPQPSIQFNKYQN